MKDIKDIILEVSPYYQKKGEPEAEHTLLYDSSAETLEPVYFFILDLFLKMSYILFINALASPLVRGGPSEFFVYLLTVNSPVYHKLYRLISIGIFNFYFRMLSLKDPEYLIGKSLSDRIYILEI